MCSQVIKSIFLNLILTSFAQAAGPSSFVDVKQVLLDDAVPVMSPEVGRELEVYRQGELPQYEMNVRSIFQYGSAALENAAKRTVSDKSDYLERLPKLLHPNGVCVLGRWEIDRNSEYSGAFAAGTQHLFIGRVSVAMQETTSKSDRGFGFAGKLFPTVNENEAVATENFFTVDVLMGAYTPRFLDTATTNEPEMGFNIWLVKLGLKIAQALGKADANPGFRPLKNLGSLGVSENSAVKFPHWIRLSAENGMKRNNQADFRNEVLQAVHDNTELVFNIDGSDTTKKRTEKAGWKHLGQIRINQAVVSYGCDRRLHFAHPKLK